MPELPDPKIRVHPSKASGSSPRRPVASSLPSYAELTCISNFSFLRGASHPEEIVERAAGLGLRGVAVTDVNSLAGIVRAHVAAKRNGVPLVVGSRVELADPRGLCVHLYPTDRAAYGRLCRLLTLGKRRTTKGACALTLDDVRGHAAGLLAVLSAPERLDARWRRGLRALREAFDDDRLSLAAAWRHDGRDRVRIAALDRIARRAGVPLVATGDVAYHDPDRRPLHDVLACIRHGCTIDEAGHRLAANAERHLRDPAEIVRLFDGLAPAVRRSVEIAERAGGFSLDAIRYEYPDEVCPDGRTPDAHLRALAEAGLVERYPCGAPDRVRRQVEHELALIAELRYAPYFLTVHDLVVFARSRGILCQGRGAAANSAVCYCLGVTAVDPDRIDLLFERFVSRERDEPPDIDIDFEHERREEVIQYVYGKYGRDRAALTAEVITYRGRSAVREVGKALGLSLDATDRLARDMDWWSDRAVDAERIRGLGLDPDAPIVRRFARLVGEIMGFPRHLSQHVGGFVITRAALCELVPVENAAMPDRTVIEWDKDDIDAMGMMKVDCLGLGMLTCLRKAFEMVEPPLELHTVPPEDPHVYDMLCRADTIGVFQIESRAQMSMLPRLRPRCFYDLVIEVAIVRPGPIQGDMVHPYLRRRRGEEPVTFPSEAVRQVLGKTLGVPLFQEQAMALAIVAAGFTPGEADELRRAMAAWKRKGNDIERFGRRLVDGMEARGYETSFAERCFAQIKGFSEYGFPESHAASFALLVYVSAWLKCHEPAAFAAALINSQPMGFYAPAQIIQDARNHGVEVRAVDVGHSAWDCTLEEGRRDEGTEGRRGSHVGDARDDPQSPSPSVPSSLRLGLRLVKGLREDHGRAVETAVREHGMPSSIAQLRRRSGVPVEALRRLARADAFRSMGLGRQAALWQVRALPADDLPLFDGAPEPAGDRSALPAMGPLRQVMDDYAAVRHSLRAHPVSFLRDELDARGVLRAADVAGAPDGSSAAVAGIAIVRQRPSTAAGIVFMTLEDETGIANLVVRPSVYDRFRKAARHGIVLLAEGRVEREGSVVHVVARSIEDLDDRLAGMKWRSRDFR